MNLHLEVVTYVNCGFKDGGRHRLKPSLQKKNINHDILANAPLIDATTVFVK